jgi:hypothetical protein
MLLLFRLLAVFVERLLELPFMLLKLSSRGVEQKLCTLLLALVISSPMLCTLHLQLLLQAFIVSLLLLLLLLPQVFIMLPLLLPQVFIMLPLLLK